MPGHLEAPIAQWSVGTRHTSSHNGVVISRGSGVSGDRLVAVWPEGASAGEIADALGCMVHDLRMLQVLETS